MYTQQAACIKRECLVLGPRRVVVGEIQGLEVVVVILDFRPRDNLKAQPPEYLQQPFHGPADGVAATNRTLSSRQGDINGHPVSPLVQPLARPLGGAVANGPIARLLSTVQSLHAFRAP